MVGPPPPPRRAGTVAARVCLVVAGLALFGVLTAPPAAADGARPGNFESIIDSVEADDPSTLDGVEVDVVGNDAFLRVRADPGVEVRIPGYDGEPYLWIDADGTVRENRRSAAPYLNEDRDGSVDQLPGDVGPDAEPQWEVVADDGQVAWHDHRIHFMGTSAPPRPPDGVVAEWVVPLRVDGSSVEITGRLVLVDDIVPWPAAVTLVAAGAAAWAGGRTRRRGPVLLAGSAAALTSSIAWYAANPPGAEPALVPLGLSAVAVVASLVATLARGRTASMVLPLAAASALVGWFLTRAGVWWMPLLPTPAPEWLDRVLSSAVLGVAVGIVTAVLLSPDGHDVDAAAQVSSSSASSSQSSTPPMS